MNYKSIDLHHIKPKVKQFKSSINNTCIVSVVNDSFFEYFIVFARSILEHNQFFNFDWLIYYGSEKGCLNDENKKNMEDAYNNIKFIKVNEGKYSKFNNLVPGNLFASLFKLDLFNLSKYKKIVCLDVDTLCLGDISDLFKFDYYLAASIAGGDYNKHLIQQGYFKRIYNFNAGILIYGEKIIKDNIYQKLLNYNKYAEFAEQTILNSFFKFTPKYLLPFKYNFHATLFKDYIEENDVRILHYAGPKPTKEPNLPQMKYWLKAKRTYT